MVVLYEYIVIMLPFFAAAYLLSVRYGECGCNRKFFQRAHSLPIWMLQITFTVVGLIVFGVASHDLGSIIVWSGMLVWYLFRVWMHEKDKWTKKAKRALGRVKQMANGRLKVVSVSA